MIKNFSQTFSKRWQFFQNVETIFETRKNSVIRNTFQIPTRELDARALLTSVSLVHHRTRYMFHSRKVRLKHTQENKVRNQDNI